MTSLVTLKRCDYTTLAFAIQLRLHLEDAAIQDAAIQGD